MNNPEKKTEETGEKNNTLKPVPRGGNELSTPPGTTSKNPFAALMRIVANNLTPTTPQTPQKKEENKRPLGRDNTDPLSKEWNKNVVPNPLASLSNPFNQEVNQEENWESSPRVGVPTNRQTPAERRDRNRLRQLRY